MNNEKTVTLRAPEPEDLELLYTIENDTEAWDICSARTNYSRFVIKQYIACQPQDISTTGELRLVITDEKSGKAVGLIDLTSYSAIDRSAEIGITLLKEERGKGYGKTAVKAIEHHAKNFLNIRMLYAYTMAEGNETGYKLFTTCGYTAVATLPEWHFCKGKYVDLIVFKKKL